MADAVRFLSNDDVAALLDVGELVETLEETYADLADGTALTGPKVSTHAPVEQPGAFHRLKTMGGAVPSLGVQGLRIDSDLLHWPTVDGSIQRRYITAADRDDLRVGPENGLVVVYDVETAEPLLIAPDGRMQRRRVGATSALAARHLAREDATAVGLLGSGWQAGAQLLALDHVRDLERVDVYSPTRAHREDFADRYDDRVAPDVRAVDTAEAAVAGKDVVHSATDSLTPTVDPDWLEPGVHVAAVKRQEVTAEAFDRADRVAMHTTEEVAGRTVFPDAAPQPDVGDAGRWWTDEAADHWERFVSLQDLCGGVVPGRESAEEATLFVNNVGIGVQFAVCGYLLNEAARAADAGHELPVDWFLQDVAG